MAKEPVSIGNQKFIYDDKRQTWVDSKTKMPADAGLIAVLESVSKDVPAKPKRLNIDRSVEPVTLGSMKYVYDKNMGWVDEKTKVPADLKLAKALNDAVGNKKEAAKKNISKSVVSGTGSFVSNKKDVKTDAAYRKISDGLAQSLASIERINGHSQNIILMNRFRFKEDARVSREKAREGGGSGSSQVASMGAAQTMAVMATLVASVTESMKEFTTALKDTKDRGGFGGGGIGGDIAEAGSNTVGNVVGAVGVAVAAASYGAIALKKGSEDDNPDADSPVGQPAASETPRQDAILVNNRQQALEEGEEEEEPQTAQKATAAGGAVAASRAAKDIPTPTEKEDSGGPIGGSRNIKVNMVAGDEKMGSLQEPKPRSKTAVKVQKKEKKAEASGGGGSKSVKRVPTAGPKSKPVATAAPAQKSSFFPKVAWGKAFASIGKVLSDMKKAAEMAIQNAANAASNAGQVIGDTISNAGSTVSGAVGEMVYGTVQPPTKGLPGLVFQAAKKQGFDDNMAIAMVAVCEKETGFKLRPEVMNYTSAKRLDDVFGKNKGFTHWTPADWQPYVGQPQKLANLVYGGLYGNNKINDGWTYRGRGLNGITFKSTYAWVGKAIGVDLVSNPDALNNMNVALPAWVAYHANHPIIRRRGKTAATLDEAIKRAIDVTAGTKEGWWKGSGKIQQEALSKTRQFAAKYTAGGLVRMAQEAGNVISSAGEAVVGAVQGAGQRIGGAIQNITSSAGKFLGIAGLRGPAAEQAARSLGATGANGRLDENRLESTGQLGTKAVSAAARAFKAMVAAAAKDGVSIRLSGNRSAYRTFKQQQEIFATARPGYAAQPGTSNHGWGLAFDLQDTDLGTKTQKWLWANASKFGIFGPLGSAKKAAAGQFYELWHWEYRGGGSNAPVTQAPPAPGKATAAPSVLPQSKQSADSQAIQQVALRQAADKRNKNAGNQGGGRVQTGNKGGKGSPPPRQNGGGKKTKVESSSGLWKSLFG